MAKLPDGTGVIWVPPGRAPRGLSGSYVPEVAGHTAYGCEGIPEPLALALTDGLTFAAHNALGFDAMAWERLCAPDMPQPEWYDTLPCARAAGLPGGLDEIGERLTGQGKTEHGKKAMLLLSRAKWKPGAGPVYTVGTSALWDLVIKYTVQDVALLERVFHETIDCGEPDVLEADRAINSRGVRIDRKFAEALQAIWSACEWSAGQQIGVLTDGEITSTNIRATEQVKRWVESQGVKLDRLDKHQVGRLLDNPEEFSEDADAPQMAKIVEVLSLRQVAVSASAAKLSGLQSRADGETDRVKDSLVYHGAGPGRWTGRGVQLHNMARGHAEVDVPGCLDLFERGEFYEENLRPLFGKAPLRDALSSLIRPVFCSGPDTLLAIADFAGIEARGLAWVADDHEMLDIFRTGGDPYKVMAGAIFGVEPARVSKEQRQIGKVVVLGCGYGMGHNKFGLFCKQNRIDLEAVGTSAQACISTYREARHAVKSQWKRFDQVVMAIVRGDRLAADEGKCDFAMREGHLLCRLPSGRVITYRNARVEMLVPPYCKMLGLPEVPKPSVVYMHPRGYVKSLYGGLITENIVQAICRDLLALALVRCEAEELPVVMHVHDEIVCEVETGAADAALDRLCEIMAESPPWAEGFPIGVEGFLSNRYVKAKLPGFKGVKR